jgi:hypothetical protein
MVQSRMAVWSVLMTAGGMGMVSAANAGPEETVEAVFDSVRQHAFHPIVNGFTKEPALDHHDGVADFNKQDWRGRWACPTSPCSARWRFLSA